MKAFRARPHPICSPRFRVFLLPLWLLLLISVPAFAAPPNGYPLIARALRAKATLVVTGRQDIVWTRVDGDRTEIVTDIARAGRRSRMTYRCPPDACGRVLVDNGAQTALFEPARRVVLTEPSVSTETEAETTPMLALLDANYCCRVVRCECLCGRVCDVVAITPRSTPGPSKQCWIERAHHAILRTEDYDAHGSRRYVSRYETVCFPARLPARFLALPLAARRAARLRSETRPVALAALPQAFRAVGIAGRLPAWLPRGYALLRCARVHPLAGRPAVLLRYGDGLKTMTVLEQPPDASGAARNATAMNGTAMNGEDMNRALSRYGQQAWMEQTPAGCFIVRGDLSLPRALGREMLAALAPQAEYSLAHKLGQDFGPRIANTARRLRRRGWSYEQIAAVALLGQRPEHHGGHLQRLLARGLSWPKIMHTLTSDTAKQEQLEARARAWVLAAVAPGTRNQGN